MAAGLARILALAVMAVALMPTAALADGDPASDVLIGENVFYPYSPVSKDLQERLNAETAAASRVHFPIKVALIPAPTDLGAIPSLFGKPQQYADFLVQEISFLNIKRLLLVVMPDGYGVQGLGSAATAAAASLRKPLSDQSNDLARAAILAVPKLAAAAGHPVKDVPDATAVSSGGGATPLTAGLLAAAAVASAAAVLGFRQRRARAR